MRFNSILIFLLLIDSSISWSNFLHNRIPDSPRVRLRTTFTNNEVNFLVTTQSGAMLVAPDHEYNHFLMNQVIFIYEVSTNGDSRGVILERPTAFTVDEMVPGFDMFSSNRMFTGGEDGGQSVIMLHNHSTLNGARSVGSGIFCGGVVAAKDAVAAGRLPHGDFKFFFNHVKLTNNEIRGMVDKGGWKVLCLSDQATPREVLHNYESGLWDTLRSISKKHVLETD